MSETVFAQWTIDKSQHRFWVFLISLFVSGIFLVSFYSLFIVTKTDNLILAIIPILTFLLLAGVLPEAFKSWNCLSEEGKIFITEKGIYLKSLNDNTKYKFASWENIASYDLKYTTSMTPLGVLFPKPTEFFLKGRYEEDSFSFSAFGENVDVTRAYLKEKNISFGFIQK